MNNPTPKRVAASTSFNEAEVEALEQLFRKLRTGSDVGIILRSAPMANIMKKVGVMRTSIENAKAERSGLDRLFGTART